jgi:hypothetical protein
MRVVLTHCPSDARTREKFYVPTEDNLRIYTPIKK